MVYKQYCKDYENIENYEKAKADDFKNWEVHHRLETHTSDGERRLVDISAAELQALDMYYNRPASELIFMKHSEHSSLHNKGENNPNYGKHFSEEAKKKMSEAKKGKNIWIRGRHWYNNGKISKRAYECPDGFVPGKLLIYKETEK